MDFNLIACARHHLTYAPIEQSLRDRLRVDTPADRTPGDSRERSPAEFAWRCLRCGNFVPGMPRATGPAEDAPVPLRGQMLRDAIVLRLLAVDRLLKGAVVLFAAYMVMKFRSHHDAVQQAFDADLPLLEPVARSLHWSLTDSSIVHTLRTILHASTGTLAWIAAGLVVYALLQVAEAVGLWLLKRWGEYLSAVATSVFIPLEIYELIERVTWLRVAALIINIAAVAFLVYRKRLFGVRGGRSAYEAERHHESLIEISRSTTQYVR